MVKHSALARCLLAALLVLPSTVQAASAEAVTGSSSGAIVRVSVSSSGLQGDNHAGRTSISADGRFVAFESQASNLVAGDTNGYCDVFVHDRATGATTRVSVGSLGSQSAYGGSTPSISGDGRYVAFMSSTSDLVTGDTNGKADIFVHDRVTGVTSRVSVSSSGAEGDSSSYDPSISADGRYVAFESYASNLVAGDTNANYDVFVHDRVTGVTSLESLDSSGVQGNKESQKASISAEGRYVAFVSYASNLVAGDENGSTDAFLRDRVTGSTIRVGLSVGGAYGWHPSISADGRFVAFSTYLYGGDAGPTDVGVYDRITGGTTWANHDSSGAKFSGLSPSISADGRRVAFMSSGGVSVYDSALGAATHLMVPSSGVQIGSSYYPAISADGRCVAFVSGASNLVAGDTNGFSDVFVHDQGGPEPGDAEDPYPDSSNGQRAAKAAIVLVGGLNEDYGFDDPADSRHPWHDVYTDLKIRGYDVYVVPSMAGGASSSVVDSLGGYTGDNAAHVQDFMNKKGLANRDIIMIGHSMGGLIVRKWAGSPWLWRSSGMSPKAIIQLGTPNAGSPLPALLQIFNKYTYDRGSDQSIYELSQDGSIIGSFNQQYQNTSGIPILRLGGEFFPESARQEALSTRSPQQAFWNGLLRTGFGLNTPNDGAVSVESLLAGPTNGSRGSTFYPVMHTDCYPFNVFASQGFILPKSDTPVERDILLAISNFVFAVSEGQIAPTPAPTSGSTAVLDYGAKTKQGLMSATVLSASDSAFTTIVNRSLALSSSSTTTVQFSVEGTAALAEVFSSDPGVTFAVRGGGKGVASTAQATPSGLVVSFATTPGGTYSIEMRSAMVPAVGSLRVFDTGPTALVVGTQQSGIAGSDVRVTARMVRSSSDLPGSFSASIDGGPIVTMSDSGSGADVTASDGVYSVFVRLPASGMASRITVDATATSGGITLQRTGFGLTEIVEPRATITGVPTLSTGVTPSGKVGQVFVDVPVSTSQDCTLQVAANLSSASALMAQSTAQVTLASGKVTVVRVSFEAADLQGFGSGASQVLASVKLYDSTDGGLSLLDSDTSGPLSLSGSALALASCTIDPLDARLADGPVTVTGTASCTSETISGIDISLDGGTEWLPVPTPPGGWGPNETTWSCAFILSEGEYGASVRLRGQNGLIAGATDSIVLHVDGTAPTTTSNRAAYYATSATILLTPTDNTGGSGVVHTYYRLNGAAQVEGTTITKSTAGSYSLVYWSVDAAGNIEVPHTVTFTIIAKPSTGGTPSTPASIATLRHGRSFTVYGYIIKHTAGTYPVTLQFYRYQSGHWVLRKSTTAKVSNMLTFSKYSDSTSVPYSGKWRVRARHKVGTKYLYSGYRTFTAS